MPTPLSSKLPPARVPIIGADGAMTNPWRTWLQNLPVNLGSLMVAELPVTGATAINTRAVVTDATSAVFLDPAVGGGANEVPVFNSSTGWRIG